MIIYDKIKAGFYNVTKINFGLEERQCPKCNKVFYTKKDNFCSNCGYNISDYFQKFKEKRLLNLDKYHKEKKRKKNLFKKDILEKFDLTNHPNAESIFSYAYNKGTDEEEDFIGVYEVMEEIHDLFKFN